MQDVILTSPSNFSWAKLSVDQVEAHGEIFPRLEIHLVGRTLREKQWVELHVLQARLLFKDEELGEGLLTGFSLGFNERHATLKIPIDLETLQYVTDRIEGDQIPLQVDLSGWMRVKRELEPGEQQRYVEDPEPGEWGFLPFGGGRQTVLRVYVARSDWFTRVLQPVGSLRYLVTEIPLPKGDGAKDFLAPLKHLKEAESKYTTGDDAGVFASCRAALEALPGAPKGIFAALADGHEAEVLNSLMRESVDYLHRGRHVQREGPARGEFPVDHGDARFALGLTRLLLAQTSRILSKGFE